MSTENCAARPQCPFCGSYNDAITGLTGADYPESGSVSICFYCAQIGVFTGDGVTIRKPTADEDADIRSDQRVIDVIAAIQLHRAGLIGGAS